LSELLRAFDCAAGDVTGNPSQPFIPRVAIISTRTLVPGEELFANYNAIHGDGLDSDHWPPPPAPVSSTTAVAGASAAGDGPGPSCVGCSPPGDIQRGLIYTPLSE
jgi:hypothetical protein